MKDLSKLFSIILVLTISVFPLAAQDDVEEAEGEEAVEEVVEEAEMFEEEMEDVGSPFTGFTLGLNFGMPVMGGAFYEESGMDPVFGLVIGTPYGLPLGPFNVGVNAGIESANGLMGVFGILNVTVTEVGGGPVSVFGGVGLLEGIGIIGGASWDYSMDPIVIKPYVRGTITTGAALDEDGDAAPTGWIQVGAMVSYDISTLF